ncbi:Tudor/PWWP/MBT superfamily protein [Zea mays]|nr:Tudor/PWWP/MBT superfamily protein [Zea mays]AQK73847.1 Tudor/PWWP/MBT superfamily protein [Zea mays]AQK73848.1 Tudor/PWWP/MBT superfamily protein [Zea mays]AQK73849.1 Tudor/PWWP/MBT superfamily protein [Zea mays]AQK73851.1 Tudor/PWWP/MBT superfamily protein [Zea mays]
MGNFSHLSHSHGGDTLENKESTIVKKNRSDGSDFEDSLVSKSDRRRPISQVLQSSENLLPHLKQNNDFGALLIKENNNPSLATSRSRRNKYTYMASDSGETQSHSDLPSIKMTATGADFENESYLRHTGYFSEEQTSSDFVEKQVTESSERECSESETEEDAELLQNASVILPIESHAPDPYSVPIYEKFKHVDYGDNEVAYSNYMPQLNESEEEDGSSELGVSQWHMKGKRNNRNATKRSVDMRDGNTWLKNYNGSLKGSLHNTNDGNPRKEGMHTSGEKFFEESIYQIKEEPSYDDSDETNVFEDTSHSEANLYYGKRCTSFLRTTRDLSRRYSYFNDYENDSSNVSPLNKDTEQMYHVDRNAYWDGPSFYQTKLTSRFGGMRPMLFNVNLKVQASYQGEHVPLVSLMSRLNGKAIVGHPIQIEIVEDGSTDHLILCGDSGMQESSAAPPAWPTGRRTAMQRVPRSNPSGALLDGDNEGGLVYSDYEMKPTKLYTSSNHQVKVNKKSSSNTRRSVAKSQKKSSKKTNLSSQKRRVLSSISTAKKHHGEGGRAKAHWRNDILGGLIRSEGVPLVTCVPTKVVFTRILEAVGRPPLSVVHRVRMTSPSVRDPP